MKTALKEKTFLFITINILLNKVLYIYIFINSNCLCFNIMIKEIVKQNKLKQFPVFLQQVINVINKSNTINKIIKAYININKYIKICYFYIKNNNFEYNFIFSKL